MKTIELLPGLGTTESKEIAKACFALLDLAIVLMLMMIAIIHLDGFIFYVLTMIVGIGTFIWKAFIWIQIAPFLRYFLPFNSGWLA